MSNVHLDYSPRTINKRHTQLKSSSWQETATTKTGGTSNLHKFAELRDPAVAPYLNEYEKLMVAMDSSDETLILVDLFDSMIDSDSFQPLHLGSENEFSVEINRSGT